ncbi:alkaline phosphatase D family protein [Siphonobacter aquaeclarae]|uniref:Alkaline phosphatase D n=1 Tax=Siphonobacter aquaeclarae TaxID=563176 RepID=A0A1G9RFM5_9BACT|nr:alkaline phosphatase D family protein [Siphonobacter aquaeclarae]SDM21255.1 alkaline phosphatase D [Siphonobacter aquaeclarae]
MRKWLFFLSLLAYSSVQAQLQSGPMLGYSDYMEVMLWAQTQKAAKVKIVYWETGSPSNKRSTDEVSTEKSTAYIARMYADQVLPGKKYEYEIWVDGKKVARPYPLQFQTQTLWQFRTDPPAFTFAFGSCAYFGEPEYDRPGAPYGQQYEIFTKIDSLRPDFMVWGGDNNYYREVDFGTRTGMLRRMTHGRSFPQIQSLLAHTHNYATWDDHDYGPNDADRSYWMKRDALDIFKLFWGNPNYAFEKEGVNGTFQWGDCQFFLLDDRWWRAPNELDAPGKDYLGQKQLDWLIDALKFSQATFKFVVCGGQVINPAAQWENYAVYGEERAQLLERITAQKIPGVVFLSGDRHHTAVHKLERFNAYPLYDFTISPFTSGPARLTKEETVLSTLDKETVLNERNFAIMSLSGPKNDRVLKVQTYNARGELKWTREIKAASLK